MRGRSLLLSAPLPSLGRYVKGMVHLFYQSDDIVRGDPELQAWCREITEVGLCHAQDRGKICSRDGAQTGTHPASAAPQTSGMDPPTIPSLLFMKASAMPPNIQEHPGYPGCPHKETCPSLMPITCHSMRLNQSRATASEFCPVPAEVYVLHSWFPA